jgi:lipopolysaccharide transport system ATP-binding protein
MTVVVKTENLGKKFIISHERPERYTALRDVIVNKSKEIINKTRSLFNDDYHPEGEAEEFWALKDINLEIKQGDRLGIIGKNGAGKSTLLKILSRITEPTTGWVGIKGRVASLLEVGTGFHPELTGKENIFLNGAILGMTRSEIKKKFDEIVDFSGVEKFLDTPVKRYSSGMRVRLAFSVAAHLEPEILIIDEVLAVGDASFQKKCLGKMKDVAGEGRTVIFVSHNMVAVQSLCNKGLLLKEGMVDVIGDSTIVVQKYISNFSKQSFFVEFHDMDNAPGNSLVKVQKVWLEPINPEQDGILTMETSFRINVHLQTLELDDEDFGVTIQVFNEENIVAFGSSTLEQDFEFSYQKNKSYFVSCEVPGNLLNSGFYFVNILFVRNANVMFKVDESISFSLAETERKMNWYGKRAGIFRPKLDWTIQEAHQYISAL